MTTRQITVRLKEEIFNQISARAELSGTSLSIETNRLLGWALDRYVEADKQLLQEMHDKLSPKTPSTPLE